MLEHSNCIGPTFALCCIFFPFGHWENIVISDFETRLQMLLHNYVSLKNNAETCEPKIVWMKAQTQFPIMQCNMPTKMTMSIMMYHVDGSVFLFTNPGMMFPPHDRQVRTVPIMVEIGLG
jgi:hypothetical protein